MQNNLYFAWYGQHFIIVADHWPYPAIPNEISAPQWVESKAMHKDIKKAYDTIIALQTIQQNQLIDTVPDDYLNALWDPDEGYNQSTFCTIIFYILDWYTLITNTILDENKLLFDQSMEIIKQLAVYI